MTALPRILKHLWLALALFPVSASADTVRIYVTNSAGDNIHVIDPATNKVVQVFKGPEAAHGIAFSPDGARVYVSNEHDLTLDAFDRKSGKLIKQVPLSNRPNNIAVAKDGRIVVGIARGEGALDIIDPATLTIKKTIPLNGRLHNVYVTPDSKYVITGSIPKALLTVIDLATEQVAWETKMSGGVRPMAIEANPDGSTKRIFAQLSDLNGFAVVDFAERKETARIELPKTTTNFETDRRPQYVTVARHRRHAGQQDPVGHQHSQQRRVRLFARRPEDDRPGRAAGAQAAGARADLGGGQLGHLHAGLQNDLRVERRLAVGDRDRHRGHEGEGRRPRRRSAEADQHAGHSRRAER